MSASLRGQRDAASALLRTNVSRAGPAAAPAITGFQRVAGATVRLRARPCAARRAARAAAPSTAASSPPPSRAGRRSSSPARASPLRRTSTATPAGPTPARCRRSAARPESRRRRSGGALLITAARRGSAEHGERCGNEELPARVHRGPRDGSSRPPRGCIACCGSHPVTRLARRSTGTRGGIRLKPDSQPCVAEHDLVGRLEPDATGTPRNRHGATAAHDPGPVFAAVVVQPKLP